METVTGRQHHWKFTELTTSWELEGESCQMLHCVAGYSGMCMAGCSAIFSLRYNKEKILTIEVHPTRRKVVQVRGLLNRMATRGEFRVIRLWFWKVIMGSDSPASPSTSLGLTTAP